MNPDLPPAPQLIEGPDSAPATVLLAHGAGAPMDSTFMATIAGGLAESDWRVVRFEFPYMARMRETARRQGADRMLVQQEAFRQQVRIEKTEWPQRRLFIGGKSMGGPRLSVAFHSPSTSNPPRRREHPQQEQVPPQESPQGAPARSVCTEIDPGLTPHYPITVHQIHATLRGLPKPALERFTKAFRMRFQVPADVPSIANRICQRRPHDWIEAFLIQHQGTAELRRGRLLSEA